MNGQLKLQEMAFVLVALVFLAGITLLFYVSVRTGGVAGEARELAEAGAIGTIAHLPGVPGLGGPCPHCLDLDTLFVITLLNRSADSLHQWDLDYLQFVRAGRNGTCTPVNYPDCATLTLTGTQAYGTATRAFVAACFWDGASAHERCELGVVYASGRALHA
jgi:hypothetical protein